MIEAEAQLNNNINKFTPYKAQLYSQLLRNGPFNGNIKLAWQLRARNGSQEQRIQTGGAALQGKNKENPVMYVSNIKLTSQPSQTQGCQAPKKQNALQERSNGVRASSTSVTLEALPEYSNATQNCGQQRTLEQEQYQQLLPTQNRNRSQSLQPKKSSNVETTTNQQHKNNTINSSGLLPEDASLQTDLQQLQNTRTAATTTIQSENYEETGVASDRREYGADYKHFLAMDKVHNEMLKAKFQKGKKLILSSILDRTQRSRGQSFSSVRQEQDQEFQFKANGIDYQSECAGSDKQRRRTSCASDENAMPALNQNGIGNTHTMLELQKRRQSAQYNATVAKLQCQQTQQNTDCGSLHSASLEQILEEKWQQRERLKGITKGMNTLSDAQNLQNVLKNCVREGVAHVQETSPCLTTTTVSYSLPSNTAHSPAHGNRALENILNYCCANSLEEGTINSNNARTTSAATISRTSNYSSRRRTRKTSPAAYQKSRLEQCSSSMQDTCQFNDGKLRGNHNNNNVNGRRSQALCGGGGGAKRGATNNKAVSINLYHLIGDDVWDAVPLHARQLSSALATSNDTRKRTISNGSAIGGVPPPPPQQQQQQQRMENKSQADTLVPGIYLTTAKQGNYAQRNSFACQTTTHNNERARQSTIYCSIENMDSSFLTATVGPSMRLGAVAGGVLLQPEVVMRTKGAPETAMPCVSGTACHHRRQSSNCERPSKIEGVAEQQPFGSNSTRKNVKGITTKFELWRQQELSGLSANLQVKRKQQEQENHIDPEMFYLHPQQSVLFQSKDIIVGAPQRNTSQVEDCCANGNVKKPVEKRQQKNATNSQNNSRSSAYNFNRGASKRRGTEEDLFSGGKHTIRRETLPAVEQLLSDENDIQPWEKVRDNSFLDFEEF